MNLHRLMKISPEKHIVALAGGGGKTTSLYALSRESAAAGRRTAMMTTTHIGVPRQDDIDVYIEKIGAAELQATWSAGRVAAVGRIVGDGRMIIPDAEVYALVSREAEAIYIEADGSKRLPLKYPDRHEPVIPDNADQVLVICGLSALDKLFDSFCHRAALARERLGITSLAIDEKTMAQVLSAGYGKYQPTVIVNQADTPELQLRGEMLAGLLLQAGIPAVSVLSLHWILGIKEEEL